MRKLKRSECTVLHLGLRHYWYRMIESGEKCVEFREAKPYWETRIANWARRMHDGKTPVLEFQSGYGRFSPRMEIAAAFGSDNTIVTTPGMLDAVIEAELAALAKCDAIYLLQGWEDSRGAKRELWLALDKGLDVITERSGVVFRSKTLKEVEEG